VAKTCEKYFEYRLYNHTFAGHLSIKLNIALIMYAILDVNNRQYKVKQGQEIYVDLQDAEVGTELTFNKILLADNEGSIKIGTPSLANASVSAKVLDHVKGDKVIIFKKKRRKGYKVKKGHRQRFTKVRIDSITI
jgi:large subunit ribosomal protein L21